MIAFHDGGVCLAAGDGNAAGWSARLHAFCYKYGLSQGVLPTAGVKAVSFCMPTANHVCFAELNSLLCGIWNRSSMACLVAAELAACQVIPLDPEFYVFWYPWRVPPVYGGGVKTECILLAGPLQ